MQPQWLNQKHEFRGGTIGPAKQLFKKLVHMVVVRQKFKLQIFHIHSSKGQQSGNKIIQLQLHFVSIGIKETKSYPSIKGVSARSKLFFFNLGLTYIRRPITLNKLKTRGLRWFWIRRDVGLIIQYDSSDLSAINGRPPNQNLWGSCGSIRALD